MLYHFTIIHYITWVDMCEPEGWGSPPPKCRSPQALVDYQQHMNGVDLMDQIVGYYLLNHRSKKWWRHILFYLLFVFVNNSYVLALACHLNAIRCEWPNFQDFIRYHLKIIF
jgi:hypothetical protein